MSANTQLQFKHQEFNHIFKVCRCVTLSLYLLHQLNVLQNALFYVSVSVLYLIGSSLVVHLIHMYHESYSWVPKWTRDQLLVTGVSNFYFASKLGTDRIVCLW
jgi:hypothetical protein